MESDSARPVQKFHITHFLHPSKHGPRGYREVIETLQWGLGQLGHDVTVGLNKVVAGRTNICVGGQMLLPEQFSSIPPDSIFYNLEQLAHLSADKIVPSIPIIASRYRIWDYSPANIRTWQTLNPKSAVQLLPISWSPDLAKIPKLPDEDIDVLFYGIPSTGRMNVLARLCEAEIKCVYACGLYGQDRDSLIARSKIVLNLNVYDYAHVFEIVRVSYLLANEKAVVSDIYNDSTVDDDLKEAVAFAHPANITAECIRLLKGDSARRQLSARGRAIFERRDIRENLRHVLI